MSLGSTAAVKAAVKAGLGISLVLRETAREEVAAGTLVALPLTGVHLAKRLYVAHPAGLPEGSAALRFARSLTAAAG